MKNLPKSRSPDLFLSPKMDAQPHAGALSSGHIKLPQVRLSGEDFAFLQCTSQQNNHQRADLTPWCHQMTALPIAHPFHNQYPVLVHPDWAGHHGAYWQWQQYGAEQRPFIAPQCAFPWARTAPELSRQAKRKRAIRQEANREESARKSKQRQRDRRESRLPCIPDNIQELISLESVDFPKELDVILSKYEKRLIEDVLLKRDS